MKRSFMQILLFFSIFSPVFSLDLPISQIADDSLLRIKLTETDPWFTDTPGSVLARRARIEYLENGERVEVRAEAGREEFMIILSRELMGGRIAADKNPGVPRGGTGRFLSWAQGSWILTRRIDNGAPILIRVFLCSDQNAYIQFRPFTSEKCYMDVILYGGYIVRSLPLGVPFERLYTMPLNEILKLAGNKFPRRYFEPELEDYSDQRKLITQIRGRLGELRYTDDGAIDENGNYVFIDTLQRQSAASAGLNCSGFTKWLIDGILRPVTGKRLSIPPLKAAFGSRGSSFTDLWEESRDPHFGLDWIRNLAAEANGVLRSNVYRNLEEFEVRSEIFSAVSILENRSFVIRSYPGFLENAGYGVEGLYPLLYSLAIDEPYKFYLAAVNNEFGAPITRENPRGGPRLRQYFHVAALFPYFDEYGIFRIVVFESASETLFSSFRRRYPGHYINIVQIPAAAAFDP
ncbi:MAG: hypothetical protein LBH44_03505 [Treponema sp.]|nr:hypothetical protein [Treponema sp.]